MESNWKRNVMNSKQDRGEEYINSAKKLIQKKTTGPNCHCRNICFTKVDDTHKHNILEQFYSTGDKTKQDMYLGGLISVSKVQRKRPTTGEEREKNSTYKYKLRVGSQETTVCKKAFCSLHGVSKNRVSQIVKNLTLGSIMSPSDKRGKHSNRPNKISEARIAQIEEHIRRFSRRKSHYSREDNQKRSDTCQKCDCLNNTIAAEFNAETKTRLEIEKRLQLLKAEILYTKLRKYTNLAREDESVDVLSFHYQQNLPLPHIPSGDVFYKRQFWQYNLFVNSAKKREATFYMYHELTAKKGCNEVQIIHHFPGPGHSFVPCDRCFGLIEKEKRKKEIAYLPSEWRKLVKTTSKQFRIIDVRI
ncbi:unnamed protein product [Diabrotica balteata]|uniref:Uncharacterized protein n=1 Tax=Diabrotica balteata TaxID=107213 RepID=A0A9N9SQM9_DIABA|nr:unnamed protein product [Diabrotica balteata]